MAPRVCGYCRSLVMGAHERTCQRKRPYERDYFREHGRWPTKSQAALSVYPHSRSRQRTIAARKTSGHSLTI